MEIQQANSPSTTPASNQTSTYTNSGYGRQLNKSKSMPRMGVLRPRTGAMTLYTATLPQRPPPPKDQSNSSPSTTVSPIILQNTAQSTPNTPASPPAPSSSGAPTSTTTNTGILLSRPRKGRVVPPLPDFSNLDIKYKSTAPPTPTSGQPDTSPRNTNTQPSSSTNFLQKALSVDTFKRSRRQRKGSSAPGPSKHIQSLQFDPDFFKIEQINVEIKEHRDRVVNEILTSEQSYNMYLKILIHLFQKPMLSAARIGTLGIKEDVVKQLFGSIDAVYGASSFFVQEFANRLRVWSPTQKIGDIFLKLGDLLKVYAIYARDHEKSTELLISLQDNPSVQDFLNNVMQHPQCNYRPLNDFLIMPVQRVPRYELLLRDLIKHTPETHCDYNDLCAALEKIKAIASQVDESVEVRKRQLKMLAIQKQFATSLNLLAPSREFIKEGELFVDVDKGKKKVRKFWLFNDILIYGSAIMGTRYVLSARLPLETITVSDIPDSDKVQFAFQLKTPIKTKAVAASSQQDKTDWINAILQAQAKFKERTIKNHMSTRPISPEEWMNDEATECVLCSQQFGLVNRRHHCRACGIAVCAACSPKSMPMLLPGMTEPSLQRVCIKCWANATQSSGGT